MKDPLLKYFRSCCVNVIGENPGTGFFIAPKLIVTCFHVLGQSNIKGNNIHLEKWDDHVYSINGATVLDVFPNVDLAFIETIEANENFAPLGIEIEKDNQVTAYGFPYRDRRELDRFTARFESRTRFTDKSGKIVSEIKFKGGQVEPGYSGAPLLNLATGKVVGVVTATRDRSSSLGGWAIEIETVLSLLSSKKIIIPNTSCNSINDKNNKDHPYKGLGFF